MNAASFDFTAARFKHLNWKFRLRAFLDGKETITMEQAVSHRDCDLGKWLYETGIEKYKKYNEMHELEKIHESLHSLIKKIVDLKRKDENDQAEEEFKKVEGISKNIIGLLDIIEKKSISN
ncbi:MAG: hypothetical protein A3F72_14580 [Bacteroidetes bacterium RIFCSPLOWO2_12_FULL_35_15]|nr:MAG: hypothetical protein A3F72_14580 [Bacteroidetes bacterium RIFCSPLOWO2_12_FULL_35_15]